MRDFDRKRKNPLGKLRARLHRVERARAQESLKARRLDTRQKIELGGLIVKAGMREQDKAALYGGLVELADKLNDPAEFSRLRQLGEKLFRL